MSQSRLSFAPLLLHGDLVPEGAREALRSAYAAPLESRDDLLRSAASVLARETDLECHDVRELVGLSADFSCG
jgi:hypothetical protein